MSRSSDLAGLIAQTGGPEQIGMRQGVVVEWDQATGSNAVNVGGTILNDLPVLTVNDVTIIEVGDVVVLLRLQSAWFILGRIQPAAPPDPNRQTLDFDSDATQETGFAITATATTRVSFTFDPPAWADEASVMVGQIAQGINTTAAQDYMLLQPVANGEGLAGMRGGAGPGGGSGFGTAVGVATLAGPFTGPILIEGRVWAENASWGVHVSNTTAISATILYRRIN